MLKDRAATTATAAARAAVMHLSSMPLLRSETEVGQGFPQGNPLGCLHRHHRTDRASAVAAAARTHACRRWSPSWRRLLHIQLPVKELQPHTELKAPQPHTDLPLHPPSQRPPKRDLRDIRPPPWSGTTIMRRKNDMMQRLCPHHTSAPTVTSSVRRVEGAFRFPERAHDHPAL